MCWLIPKSPAKFPDCKGKAQGTCISFMAETIEWCLPAQQRGSGCNSTTPMPQKPSSTFRRRDCPLHRSKWNIQIVDLRTRSSENWFQGRLGMSESGRKKKRGVCMCGYVYFTAVHRNLHILHYHQSGQMSPGGEPWVSITITWHKHCVQRPWNDK